APTLQKAQASAPPAVIAPAAPVEPRVRLAQLATEVSACRRCGLGSKRHQAAFGRGDVGARVMFVGEAPGQEDDKQGKPFVGRPGQLLDKMISAMKLSQSQVYIC